MITINLKPGNKRAKGRPSLATGLSSLKGLGEKIKDPVRLGAAVVCLGLIGFVAFAQIRASSKISGMEPRLNQARTENQRFRAFLSQKRRLESVRDSIGAQILTIRNVDGDRYIWPHILDEVSRAVPPYTWLINVAILPAGPPPPVVDSLAPVVVPPVLIQIKGRTMDIQGYTRLLRQLEDSPYLKDVTAVSAQTVVDQNRAVTEFLLRATFSRPGGVAPAALTRPEVAGAEAPKKAD
ncbi:MAG: PilN domain-containing protein [Gemmatimonadota bacterium]